MKIKKLCVYLLAATLVFTTVLPMNASADGKEIQSGADTAEGWTKLSSLADAFSGYDSVLYKYDETEKVMTFKGSQSNVTMPNVALAGKNDELDQKLKSVEEVRIEENIINVGNYNFTNESGKCPKLKKVKLGENVTNIGEYAFKMTNLEEINLNKVTVIGQAAFWATKLTKVKVDSEGVTIGISAFNSCAELTEFECKELTDLKTSAFKGCSKLATVKADEINIIGNSAFKECSLLKTLAITNENISSVGNMAFQNSGVEKLTFNNVDVTFGARALACDKLKAICYGGTSGQWNTKVSRAKVPTDTIVHCKSDNITEDVKEATCTETGIEEKTCGICNMTFKAETKALDHEYGDYVTLKEATCTEKGLKAKSCKRAGCGHIEKADIPATGHDYGDAEYTEVKKATCDEEGLETRPCQHEGCTVEEEKTIPATGHDYGDAEYTEVKKATCDEEGLETRPCQHEGCTVVEEKAIPATGHGYGVYQVVKEATCEQEGKEVRTCTHEGCEKTEEKAIKALEHDYVTRVITEATCTKDGVVSVVCSRCNKLLKIEVAKATGEHKWSQWKKVKEATVMEAEKQERTCEICGSKETKEVGTTIAASATVNAKKITLKVKQKTSKLQVTGMAKGDAVKTWKSSNTKIFAVSGKADGTCKLTAKKKGTARLTITLESGLKKIVNIKVQKETVKTTALTGVATKVTMKKGGKTTLKPVVKPFTSQQKVTYATSDKNVVSVNKTGVITAKKAGTAKITVKSGSKKKVVKVTVK